VASQQAVEEVLTALCRPADTPGTLSLRDLAEHAVCAANDSIYIRARRNPRLSGMGTTLVGLLARGDELLVMNVGDSRCYRLRRGVLEQLTLDHSLVEEQVRLGRMTPSEALRSPLRNVITRALGTQTCITPDFFPLEAEDGDLYLLCSDGLTRELSDGQIEGLLNQDKPLDEVCAALVEGANRSGGQDNITCVLVRTAS
jgi:PPM family protein phosphatase